LFGCQNSGTSIKIARHAKRTYGPSSLSGCETLRYFAEVTFALSRNFSLKNTDHAGINIQQKEVNPSSEDNVVQVFALFSKLPTSLTDKQETELRDASRITRLNSCY
jgi:hypothetical protein